MGKPDPCTVRDATGNHVASSTADAKRSAATADPADKTLRTFAILLLAAVTATYANHFFNGFHFDDFHTIVNNSYIRSLANIPRFFTDATTFSSLPTNQSYRPLVTTTLAVDYFFGRGGPFFFHLSTFLLFLCQGVVMYRLFVALFDRAEPAAENRFVALGAVAWYLLHPANAETINYIIARSDSLSTLFLLLALTGYCCWGLGRRRHLYLIPFVLSCLAKPIGAIFVPLLFVYVCLFEETSGSRLRRLGVALKKTAPALAIGLLVLIFIKRMDPPTWRAGGDSVLHYVITQPYVILHYFTTFFAPFGLSADTDWKPLSSFLDVRFLAGVLFLLALISIAACTARTARLRPIAFGLIWFLVTLVPTSLIPLAEVMNDHRLFLPYVGLVASVCWVLYLGLRAAMRRVADQRRFLRLTTVVILLGLASYAYGTHVRNEVWHSEESLWRDVTEKSPGNGRGFMNYGLALMAKGDYDGAERNFLKAQQLVPFYPYLYVNLGILKTATGNLDQAEADFQQAIRMSPRWPDGYYWYADFLNKQKRYDAAVLNARAALQLAPAHLDARKLLMDIYFEEGRFAELKTLAEQTLSIVPGNAEASRYLAMLKEKRP